MVVVNMNSVQVQSSKKSVIPAVITRGLADHDGLTGPNESSRCRQGELWWTESSGHHGVEGIRRFERADVLAHHRDSVLPTKTANDTLQEVRALRSAIEQGEPDGRKITGNDQSRRSATGAEIEHGLDRPELDECPHKTLGMSNDFGNRPGSQESESLSILQDAGDIGFGRPAHGHSDTISRSRSIRWDRR